MNIPFLSKICQHIWHKIIDKKRPRLLVIPTYFLMPYPGKKPTKETGVISPLLRYFKGKFCIMSSLIMTLFSLFCRSVPDSGFFPLFANISHPKDSAEKITHKPYISCVIPVFLPVFTLHHCLFSVNIFRMWTISTASHLSDIICLYYTKFFYVFPHYPSTFLYILPEF